MGAVEIDEAELIALQRNSQLLNKALANPKAREQVLRGLKTATPELPIPELDAAQPFNDALEAFGKRFDAMEKTLTDDKAERTASEARGRLMQQWGEGRQKVQRQGYVGESLEALEKFMEEKGVADHEVAAAAFEKLHPQPAPVANASGKFDFFNKQAMKSDGLLKGLWDSGDENAYLGPAIDEVLKQERGFAA